MRTLLLTPCLVLLLAGCQAFTPPASHSRLEDGIDWFKMNSDYRSAWIINGGLCAEASPETAKAIALVASADVAKTGVSDTGIKSDYKEAITALNERSQALLIMREAFYRLCERQFRAALTNTEYMTAFNKIIDSSVQFFEVEKAKAKAAEAGAQAVQAQAQAVQLQAIRDIAATTNEKDTNKLRSFLEK